MAAQARALMALTRAMPAGVAGIGGGVDFEKGQAGASPWALAELAASSVNPVVADATGLLLIMYNVPSLPTLPPSSVLLRHLWPRLKQYIFLDPADSLYKICVNGTAGDETAAATCFDEWRTVRAPAAQAQLAAARKILWEAFPNVDADGVPLSGSYYHETDYADDDWAVSHVRAAASNRGDRMCCAPSHTNARAPFPPLPPPHLCAVGRCSLLCPPRR
jgi:hypothetical protein